MWHFICFSWHNSPNFLSIYTATKWFDWAETSPYSQCCACLTFQASIPNKYWGECILHAAYLINRTPTSFLSNKTPFESLFHKVPSYNHIKFLAVFVMPPILLQLKSLILGPNLVSSLGSYLTKKGTNSLIIHLINFLYLGSFHENIFPFASQSFSSAIFPVLSPLCHLYFLLVLFLILVVSLDSLALPFGPKTAYVFALHQSHPHDIPQNIIYDNFPHTIEPSLPPFLKSANLILLEPLPLIQTGRKPWLLTLQP